MFGAVTAGMIADQLKTQFDIALDKKKIHLEPPITVLGEHDIELRLHSDVRATLKVRVESTTPLAAHDDARSTHGQDPARTESRGHKRADRLREEQPPAEAGAGEKSQRPDRKPRAPRPERSEKPAKAEKAEQAGKAE
jgi:large subunit ribosomal protein L9